MSITWDGSLSVGIPEIDDQHREFVRLLMKIEKGMEDSEGLQHVSNAFDELHQYVTYHFATEEHHFDEFGCYPNAQAHKAAHKEFALSVMELRHRFENNEDVTPEVARMMYDWLAQHIAHMDREYIECFKSKGL